MAERRQRAPGRADAATVVSPFRRQDHDHGHCVVTALAAADALCAERGVRLTPLRRRVLELVWQSHSPVKAYDLLDRLRDGSQRAAPPTVYRALEFLLHEGFIHRLESLNAFVGCGDPRHTHAGQFLICRRCQAVAELSDPEITRLIAERADALGFRLGAQTIELDGICPACQRDGDAGS